MGEMSICLINPHRNVLDKEINQQITTTPNRNEFTIMKLKRYKNIKSLGFYLELQKMTKEPLRKRLIKIQYIFNGIIRTCYWSKSIKTVAIIMIL